MTRRYVSNKNESVPMFESRFMEFFSHVHPATPLVLYLPVIAYFLYQVLWQRGLLVLVWLGLFAFGILIWTLLEYIIHRCVFHYEPKSRWGKFLHFMVHGVHHDYPNDASRLVMPPVVSIPLAVFFYLLITITFGRVAPPIFAGLVFGYVCYDAIHYAAHHCAMKLGIGLRLIQFLLCDP